MRTPTLAIVLRSLLFSIGQVLITLAFTPFALLAMALPYRLAYRTLVQWTFLNVWWLERTCGLTHVLEGAENIPETPTVVMCKHQSTWETINLQRYFSPQVWVLKRELLRIPVFGWGLAALRPIAIDRGAGREAFEQVLEQGSERLRAGLWVVVFPEGTRVAPGQRARYRLGGATLAASTGFPVVPVAHNSGDYWGRNRFIKYPGTIRLVIGPMISAHGRTALEINALAEEWIENTVAELRQSSGSSLDP